VLEWDKSHT